MAKIGFIGMGNMGYAILKGLLNVYGKEEIIFTDVDAGRFQRRLEFPLRPAMQNVQLRLNT